MTSEKINWVRELSNYFSTEERPITVGEFKEFWLSLTNLEKDYYKDWIARRVINN